MASALKHGGHRIPLAVSAGAAGVAEDSAACVTYDGEAAAILGTVDQSIEVVVAAVVVAAATIAAVATNNFSLRLTHYSVLGAIKNRLLLTNVAAGLAFTAGVPVDLSGAVAGNLTNPNGKTILGQNWVLVAGDSIVFERLTVGTGEATPGISCTLKVASLGA
jgi:hypothetical protein